MIPWIIHQKNSTEKTVQKTHCNCEKNRDSPTSGKDDVFFGQKRKNDINTEKKSGLCNIKIIMGIKIENQF